MGRGTETYIVPLLQYLAGAAVVTGVVAGVRPQRRLLLSRHAEPDRVYVELQELDSDGAWSTVWVRIVAQPIDINGVCDLHRNLLLQGERQSGN
jgi:hypothetical protein